MGNNLPAAAATRHRRAYRSGSGGRPHAAVGLRPMAVRRRGGYRAGMPPRSHSRAKAKTKTKARARPHAAARSGRPLWRGTISFGLVTIPVSLHTATSREELKFHLLRKSDLSPVNYKRVAAIDGKEVPWADIVKGYEYAKGKYVVLKDEDFKRVDIEAAETIEIMDFVAIDEIDPAFFMRPYYLVPDKGGANAYRLLREVLEEKGRAGITKVVIRTRQHLAAVRARGNALVLELLHFADELVDPGSLELPAARPGGHREKEMAALLVEQMTNSWSPERYADDYTSALMNLIRRKVASGGRSLPEPPHRRRPAGEVIDLAAVLQKSLDEMGRAGKRRGRAA